MIVGSNRIELEVPGGRNHRDAFVAKAFGAKAALATAYYRMDRPDAPDDPRFGSLDQQIGTDVNFRCPATHFAQIMAAKGAPVWRYEFDAAADGGKTSHAAEIPYAFGDAKLAGGLSLTPYWLNFIRSGEPNGSGVPQWPRFMSAARKELIFSDSGVSAQGPVHPQICAMLDNL